MVSDFLNNYRWKVSTMLKSLLPLRNAPIISFEDTEDMFRKSLKISVPCAFLIQASSRIEISFIVFFYDLFKIPSCR